ncbi:MAG: DNA-protecting protein DprA [Verrucomicrobiales bacterium]|nr:DNA-protecting protein DprA [Verrucomicrobiales bacterium]
MTRLESFLALSLLPGLGPVRVRKLLKVFNGDPEKILMASESQLTRADGIGAEMAKIIRDWENRIDLAEEQRRIRDYEIELLAFESDDYPEALRRIYDPPFLLFAKGKLTPRDRNALAVVGPRRTTHYGTETARKLSFQLASAGMTIVSGLARGIDTAAHEAALAAGGRTIAVLGSGVGNIYPAENEALAEKIVSQGAVLSENPVLFVPDKTSFPLRNRIVSGMSKGVLVVEAPARSGALITANQAMEQGRTVFAVPGQIDRPNSEGCHRLIQAGANLVHCANDILDELSLLPGLDSAGEDDEMKSRLDDLTDEQATVLEAMSEGGQLLVDDIVSRANLPLSSVNVALLQLEIKRLIKQLPGKFFSKI